MKLSQRTIQRAIISSLVIAQESESEMANEKNIQDGIQQDKRLVEWMRHDLHAGFNQVVEVYREYLLRVARNVLEDTPRLAHLAEDVVQDGLLSAYLNLDAYPEMLEHLKLRAWLITIIRNQAIACLKTGKDHLILNAGLLGEEVESEIEEGYLTHYKDPLLLFERLDSMREAKHTTRQLLSSLPPDQRIAIEHMYLAPVKPGKKKTTYEETAEALGKPVGTVKSQVSRAMKQMREQLIEQPNKKKSQMKKLS